MLPVACDIDPSQLAEHAHGVEVYPVQHGAGARAPLHRRSEEDTIALLEASTAANELANVPPHRLERKVDPARQLSYAHRTGGARPGQGRVPQRRDDQAAHDVAVQAADDLEAAQEELCRHTSHGIDVAMERWPRTSIAPAHAESRRASDNPGMCRT